MFNRNYYTVNNNELLLGFMNKYNFVNLCLILNNEIISTQVPILASLDDNKNFIIEGHVARKTTHHKALEHVKKASCIFNGPHCYVSANHYVNGKKISTWDFASVQVWGEIKLTNEEETLNIVEKLTNKYETLESDVHFSKIDKNDIVANLKGIQGFILKSYKVENVFKFHQHYDIESRKMIIKKLKENGDNDVAEWLEFFLNNS